MNVNMQFQVLTDIGRKIGPMFPLWHWNLAEWTKRAEGHTGDTEGVLQEYKLSIRSRLSEKFSNTRQKDPYNQLTPMGLVRVGEQYVDEYGKAHPTFYFMKENDLDELVKSWAKHHEKESYPRRPSVWEHILAGDEGRELG